jgi:hypothetical protein
MPSTFTFSGYGPHFAVLRSYVAGISATWVSGASSTLLGQTWRLQGIFGGVTTYQDVLLSAAFLAPSSNRYTPDHLVEDYYYVNLPSTTHINPLPINVRVIFSPGSLTPYLDLDSLGFPTRYFLDLTPPPPVWP